MGATNEQSPRGNEHQVQTGAELAKIAAQQNRELAEALIERGRRDGLQLVGGKHEVRVEVDLDPHILSPDVGEMVGVRGGSCPIRT